MPFTRAARVAKRDDRITLSERGTDPECMHVNVAVFWYDHQNIEICRACDARVEFWDE